MSSPRLIATPQDTDSARMPVNVRRVAAIAGMLIVAAMSFGKAPGFGILAQRLLDRPWFPSSFISELLKSSLAVALAVVAFGIARRKPAFFGMRRIAKDDIFAMLKTLSVLFATVIVLKGLQNYLFPSAPSGTEVETEELPLVYGLISAIVAGVTEEFVYRGYLIEEFGELSGRRTLAAVISVLVFALAHVGSGYGWSIELIYPALYGLALTVLYLWRRNLWVCVLMHIGLDALYAFFHAR